MQLSRKTKSFSHFLSAVLKSSLNFEHFFKKDDSYSCGSSEITECENQGEINVYKVPFQGILQKATCEMRPNIVEMSRTVPLPYLLIAVKAIVL